jgi:hypothetical protein
MWFFWNKYYSMKVLSKTSVMLQCKAGSCCPIINKIEENRFEITDDFNGKVILTKEQFVMLKESVDCLVPEQA